LSCPRSRRHRNPPRQCSPARWFSEDYLNYTPNQDYLAILPKYIDGVDIVCIAGTWCDDSRREVPRMVKLVQLLSIPPERLHLFGVDRAKKSPGGETAKYSITKVPTIVFERDGKELGRIVEAPIGLLEKDMLGIILPPGTPMPDPIYEQMQSRYKVTPADTPAVKKEPVTVDEQGREVTR
jgi:hypothetical protein